MTCEHPSISTRRGDSGETSLIGPARFAKDDLRIEVGGELDELQAAITLVLAETQGQCDDAATLQRVLAELSEIMAEIAGVPGRLTSAHVSGLNSDVRRLEASLPPLAGFVTFCGDVRAARLNVCRTIARRVERRVVSLHRAQHNVSHEVLAYLNRLSDLLFLLARRESPQ
ncbi:MAG: cob(I)yrinic acid a,c-diamide adenosyltransferase [Thermoguttaceae bacterium]